MTQEQGRPGPEKILGITFPNTVTKDHLDKIARLKIEGRSLGGSVAQVIVDEVNALQKGEIRKALDAFLSSGNQTKPPQLELFTAFKKPAQTLLEAEAYNPEKDPFWHKEEVEKETRRILNQFLELRKKHLNLKPGEDEGTFFKVSSGDPLWDKRRFAAILRDKSPLELVNLVVEEELQRWREPDIKTALNLGKDRFHQLYEAAQAAENPKT